MSEWLKEHAWKVCIWVTVSRVRISPSPLFLPLNDEFYNIYTMKKLITLLLLFPFCAFAQKAITHNVAAKESFSSIGRLYNVNGRELANFNNIDYEKGLAIGQVLKIPVANAKVKTAPVVTEVPIAKEVPIVKKVVASNTNKAAIKYTVAKKETLYAVSKKFNTTIAEIKKWNNLSEDALKEGAEIIVGYSDVAKQEKASAPVDKVEKKEVVEEKTKPVVAVVTEVVKPKKEQVIQKPIVEKTIEIEDAAKDFKGGVFKTDFENGNNNEEGTAGIFKSTSGWDDGKYYCLHNNARPGTIIKISNKANGKYLYAKVLDVKPDLKQNANLQIIISNAAADMLGAGTNNFECTISY